MITLTESTVHGAPGMTLAELDDQVCALAVTLGGGRSIFVESAADFLRDVYADVIRSAGSVDLVPVAGGYRAAVAA